MKFSQLIAVVSLGLAASLAAAQTRYVSDELVITLRTGPGTQNAITQNLVSGDRVEVLEELEDEGYSRVRVADGAEGWVLTRYLQPDLTGDQLFANVTRERDQLAEEVETLRAQLEQTSTELESTRGELDNAQSTSAQLDAELSDVREVSSNAIAIRDQNEELRTRLSEMSDQASLAEMEIRELRSQNRQSWFIVGAGVLLAGIVVGLVAPSLRRQRRSSW